MWNSSPDSPGPIHLAIGTPQGVKKTQPPWVCSWTSGRCRPIRPAIGLSRFGSLLVSAVGMLEECPRSGPRPGCVRVLARDFDVE